MTNATTKEQNLRGKDVTFTLNGRVCRGVVITRIRGTRWQVHSDNLPREYWRRDNSRRMTLDRSEFSIKEQPKQLPRRARTPIERMIDQACGVATDSTK